MKKKLIKYLFEFIVIVVSISVSFWLNELSIQNQEKEETTKVFQNIKLEIQDLKKYCEDRSTTWNQDIDLYSAFLSETLDMDRIIEITSSKNRIEYNLIYYRSFEPPMNRYKSIINSGDIKLIKSDKIKEILSRLHTFNYSKIATTVEYEKSIKEQLVQLLTAKHPSLLLAANDNKTSLEQFSNMLHKAIQKDLELKSKLMIQMEYFETRKSLLRVYVFVLEELETELLRMQSNS